MPLPRIVTTAQKAWPSINFGCDLDPQPWKIGSIFSLMLFKTPVRLLAQDF
jgi:hypothetical protein